MGEKGEEGDGGEGGGGGWGKKGDGRKGGMGEKAGWGRVDSRASLLGGQTVKQRTDGNRTDQLLTGGKTSQTSREGSCVC